MDFGSGEFIDPSAPPKSSLIHPVVTVFHLLFRTLALLVYIFGGIFSGSFIAIFVTVVLLLSLDFWTVKNITGRIMVGLRWWNYINDEGVSEWKFEARNGDSQRLLSKAEITIFWFGLVAAPAMWVLLLLSALFQFKFQWMILVIIGLSLNFSNLFGYLRCRFGSQSDVTASVSGLANSYMRKQMMDRITGMFSGTSAASPPTTGGSGVI